MSIPEFPLPKTGFTLIRNRYAGKPLKHWQAKARKLYMEMLMRAMDVDTRSIVGAMVYERMEKFVMAEDPEMYQIICDERATIIENMNRVFAALSGGKRIGKPIARKLREANLIPSSAGSTKRSARRRTSSG